MGRAQSRPDYVKITSGVRSRFVVFIRVDFIDFHNRININRRESLWQENSMGKKWPSL